MKTATETESRAIATNLSEIFPEKSYDDLRCQRFDDGISNENFLVTFANKEQFALRIVGKSGEGIVDRTDEKFNTSIAAHLGITPEILYFDTKTGLKIASFIENAETLHNNSIKTEENLSGIAEVLRRLHTSKCRLHKDFNAFTEIARYEQLLANTNGAMYDGYEDVRDKVLSLENELNKMGTNVVSCHCDALPENWIKDPTGKIWLLDWEYSGMNDPFWDITTPFIEAGFAPSEEKYFLNAYFDGNIPTCAERKVLIYKILMDYIWSIWARVKELKGDSKLHDYGIMRLNRGLNNIKKL